MIEKPGGLQIKGSGIRDGGHCLLQTALHHTIVEAAEPDDSEYRDATHCRAALHIFVIKIAAEHIRELGYAGHIGRSKMSRTHRTRTSRTHRRTMTSRKHRRTRTSRTHRRTIDIHYPGHIGTRTSRIFRIQSN